MRTNIHPPGVAGESILHLLTAVLPLLTLPLLPTLGYAETAVQAWVQRYNGPGNGEDRVTALAVDGSDNVIVTGYSMGSGGDSDYTTIKYSSAGAALWTNCYQGPGNAEDIAFALALDTNNDVVVTGLSDSSYATVKYSSEGIPLWTNRYLGPTYASRAGNAIAVDSNKDVVVTGDSLGDKTRSDYLTIKYSSAGVPLWTNRYEGPYFDVTYAVAIDRSNCVIVTGASPLSLGHDVDFLTIKYSDQGQLLWTNRFKGPSDGLPYNASLAVDSSNAVIVMGTTNRGFASYEYATVKYSSAGVAVWTNRFGATNRSSQPFAVRVDSNDGVIVTGSSDGSQDLGPRGYATIKYSSAGVPLWTNWYAGLGNGSDVPHALALDASNNVIVAGRSDAFTSNDASDYATIKYSSAGVALWTNRYSGPGEGTDSASAVAVDHSGNIIVAGYSTNDTSGFDFATVKYICVRSPVLTCLRPANGAFQLRADDLLQPGTLVIEASTNLAAWTSVFTNTTPTNVLFYTDPDASSRPTRFYRAFQFP